MGFTVDGHLAFLHAFEQAGLGAGYGAVYLICQQNVGDNRSRMKCKKACLLIIDIKAGNIGRQEIRRKLNPGKRTPDAFGQGFGQQGFGDAGHIFQQDMTLGQ